MKISLALELTNYICLDFRELTGLIGRWLDDFITALDCICRKTSYISRTLVGNKIVDNSDVVGASPVGAAPTTSSFST